MTSPGGPGAGAGRWVVTGATGMLGTDVVAALAGRDVLALARADLDVTDADAVRAVIEPGDVVVNCAAWTDVDGAETAEGAAFAVNAVGPAVLARACAQRGARLVHVSTDYVFAGTASEPYPEDALLAPRSAYGRTKAAGEWAVRAEHPSGSWVLRTAWLYGRHGGCFPATVLRLLAQRGSVDVVDDQHGQPTWTRDLARRIVDTVERGAPPGTYHATASGRTTWFGLARLLAGLAGYDDGSVRATDSAAFPRPAPRPAFSVLGHGGWAAAGLDPMPIWDESVRRAYVEGVFDR